KLIMEDGALSIKERQYVGVEVEYYADSFLDRNEKITLEAEEPVMRTASRRVLHLNSRYDSNRFLVQALDVSGETRTEIHIESLSDDKTLPKVSMDIPVIIDRSFARRWLPATVSIFGAACVALPAILGP